MKITIAKFIIILIFAIALLYLGYDLNYVLTSKGTWSVFMDNLFRTIILVVAFIALVNNKIGVNTEWMHNKTINKKSMIVSIAILTILLLILLSYSSTIQNYYRYKTTDYGEIRCIKAGLGYLLEDEPSETVCEHGTIKKNID